MKATKQIAATQKGSGGFFARKRNARRVAAALPGGAKITNDRLGAAAGAGLSSLQAERHRVPLKHEVRPDVNGAYFKTYREERGSFLNKFKPSFANMPEKFEARANSLGYSIEEPEKLVSVPWLGLHGG